MGTITTSLAELIDLRSFSNLWYWIALAVLWSTVSHWVLGIPFDMVARARRQGGETMTDLEELARINVARLLRVGQGAGLWLVGVLCFVLAVLFTGGFVYGIEFAQASFLLLFPLVMVWLLSLNTAAIIHEGALTGFELCEQITRHRFHIQALGVLFIFATATWGMYKNFTLSVLGG